MNEEHEEVYRVTYDYLRGKRRTEQELPLTTIQLHLPDWQSVQISEQQAFLSLFELLYIKAKVHDPTEPLYQHFLKELQGLRSSEGHRRVERVVQGVF